jgi:hypothetical protein
MKGKLPKAQTTMSIVWALCICLFGSKPGGVDIGGGVVQATWWFVLALLVLTDQAWVCRRIGHGCVIHQRHLVSLLGCEVGCDWEG